jgi:GAF domain-containing protein
MSRPKRSIAVDDLARAQEVIAREADPQAGFRAVDALVQKVFGHKLLTVLRLIEETVEVERLYSSNRAAYPLGGRKQKQGTPWGERVLDRGEVYIARDREDIRATFFDHELIFSLGVSGMMNVPIMFAGRCLGTLNISHDAGHFTNDDVPVARLIASLLVPLLLASRNRDRDDTRAVAETVGAGATRG